MERDFLGLRLKESLPIAKEEINNDHVSNDSGFTKVSALKWPFLNKVSPHPHLMSFNVSEEDKAKMTSSSLFGIPSGALQKSFNHDGQGGIHVSLNPYPAQHDVSSVKRPHDVKMSSVPNQAISVPMEHPFLKTHFATATVGQNMSGVNVKQPLLGGLPVTAPHSVVPIVGTGLAEPCVKSSAPAPQLTIFYAGTVSVFNDITPEKAQGIMLLAGNGLSAASNMAHPEVQEPKFAEDNGVPMSPPTNIPPCSGIASPLSVSSHIGAQSGSGSSSSDEFVAPKTSRGPATFVSKMETPKAVNATTIFQSAIPQARKASLARFLEKRKERVINAAPYNLNKKSEDAPTGTNTLSAKQG